MSGINKYFLIVGGLIVTSLSSCSSPSAKRDNSASLLQSSLHPVAMVSTAPVDDSIHVKKPTTPQRLESGVRVSPAPDRKVPVTIYTSDVQCQALIPQKVSVSAKHAGLAAVGKILEGEGTADLSLAGYRISIDQSGVATVDLRTATDSKWHLTSLSSCEQFALFGSLRRTLIGNAQWKIKDVRFTERGKEISL